MRQIKLTILIIFISLIFSGCSNKAPADIQRIVAPQDGRLLLKGSWIVDKCFDKDFEQTDKTTATELLGKRMEFSRDGVKFDKFFWNQPDYKIKNVSAEDYFFYNLRTQIKETGIDSKDVWVITVTSKDKFLYELVEIKKDLLLTRIQDKFLYLKKCSDEVSEEFKTKVEKENVSKPGIEKEKADHPESGLVLGLKTPEKTKSGINKYKYRTLWIASHKRVLEPLLQTEDILLPRRNGFWKLEIDHVEMSDIKDDIIHAFSISGINSRELLSRGNSSDFWKYRRGKLEKSLLFAGNDYICFDVKGSGTYVGSNAAWDECRLQLRPIDNIEGLKGIKISDIAGEDGRIAMEKGRKEVLKKLAIKPQSVLQIDRQSENFTLVRGKGHWFLKGRLNLKDENLHTYLDYDINLIPSSKLVFYDTLTVPWTRIKDRVPEAVDAFTSPNGDIAVVMTQNKILVYSVYDEKLTDTPLQKIELQEGDSVIMAEWALGNYVDSWKDILVKSGAVKIN